MGLVQVAGETVELMLPEAAIAGDPRVGLAHRAGDETAAAHSAVAPAHHESRVLEHPQVLGHRGQGHAERVGEGADRGLSGPGEVGEQGAPGRVGEGGERRIERLPFILNHTVKYRRGPGARQVPGAAWSVPGAAD